MQIRSKLDYYLQRSVTHNALQLLRESHPVVLLLPSCTHLSRNICLVVYTFLHGHNQFNFEVKLFITEENKF